MKTKSIVWTVVGVVASIGLMMWCLPVYFVWQQHMHGMAELSKAEFSKQVAVQEAHAKMESAKLLAEAEVERAKGLAKANEIIGKSLESNESYLWYLWLTELGNAERSGTTVIYVPTEGQMPIMEAGRFSKKPSQKK